MKQFLFILVMAAVGTTVARAQSVKNQTLVPAPSGVFLDSYHAHAVQTSGFTPSTATNLFVATVDWTNAVGGYGSELINGETEVEDFWPVVAWPQWTSAGLVEWDSDWGDYTTNAGELYPVTQGEHCDVNWNYPLVEFGWQQRTADAEYKLATGGAPGSTQKNLWVISASAWAHTNATDGFGTPIPPSQIQIGSFGNLDTNGNLYVVLPNNDPPDVTPSVPGNDDNTFTESTTEFHPYIRLNGVSLDHDNTTTNCVGQSLTFALGWSPYTPSDIADTTLIWTLPGTFVNTNSDPNCIYYYSEDAMQLHRIQSVNGTTATACWYVKDLQGQTVTATMNVTMKDGTQHNLQAAGQFTIVRPTTAPATPYQPDGTPMAEILSGTLSLGVSGVTNDMSFSHTITTDGFTSGQVGYVQLIDGNGSGDIGYTSDSVWLAGNFVPINDIELDNYAPTRGPFSISANTNKTVVFQDAPATGLYKGNARMNVVFSNYLMFKPSGGIWVPLRLITWQFNDEAGNYSIMSGWNATITSDAGSTAFPDWKNTFGNSGL